MRVRLRIDALAVEADWPRSARPDFAERFHLVLARELASAARRGAFAGNAATARRQLTLPASAFASPTGAAGGIASTVAGAVTSSDSGTPPTATGRGG